MIQHIILQGDTALRDSEAVTGAALRALLPEGVPRFAPLGIRNRRPGQEVRAFWSIPDHECGVRLIQDAELGAILASVECMSDPPFSLVVDALTAALPSVSAEVILANESQFEAMPELVFLLALATRHAPTPNVISIVKRLLNSSNEGARVQAAGAAVLLGGDELAATLKSVAAEVNSSPAAQRVFQTAVRDVEAHANEWRRDTPFKEPEEVFRIRW